MAGPVRFDFWAVYVRLDSSTPPPLSSKQMLTLRGVSNQESCMPCWTWQVVQALHEHDSMKVYGDCMLRSQQVDVDAAMLQWEGINTLSHVGDPRDAATQHRKLVTYSQWFLPGQEYTRQFMHCCYDRDMKDLVRFRLSSHNLRVETARHDRPILPYADRVCTHCMASGNRHVEDEMHVVHECTMFDSTRQDYSSLFRHEFDMKTFFSQDPRVLKRFIHAVMIRYDDIPG